jgi:siderophore synthetase component
MALAAQRKEWPRLEPPARAGRLNVLDVLLADEGSQREERLWEWAREVWQSWQQSHEWVKTTVREMLHNKIRK